MGRIENEGIRISGYQGIRKSLDKERRRVSISNVKFQISNLGRNRRLE
jgi:hypothetical protein